MSVEDLIAGAMKAGGGILDAAALFALVGQIENNTLEIQNLEAYFLSNTARFKHGIYGGSVLIGVYMSKEAAEDAIISIRTLVKDENGNIINH